MAIFHLTHSFVRRSNGSSSVATAAYNAGQKLEDNQGSSQYSDYTRKGGILYDEITLPSGSPAWANNRGELWRRLEAREDRSTRPAQAVLAHNFNIALPHELTLEQNIFLARDFVREQFTRKGYAADWAIHAPDPRGDSRNIHLHILVPLRKIEGEIFGNKVNCTSRQLSEKVRAWRKSWATLVNRHLKRYSHKAKIDERTLRAQGSKRTPTRHRGPRPKSTRISLNVLRAKQPPQPQAPIVRTTKQPNTDGSMTLRAIIERSNLNRIGSATGPTGQRTAAPNPTTNNNNKSQGSISRNSASQKSGWPPEAIHDWKTWGNEDPPRFFAKWPQLGTSNASPGGLNR